MNYRLLTPALGEVSDAAEFYDEQVAGLEADFIDELDAAITRILDFPEAWGRISNGYRHCNLRRFPYTVIYSIENAEAILIVSVFHQSRAPLSWKHNLK
jgi:plasmid stabilization system protein ParE